MAETLATSHVLEKKFRQFAKFPDYNQTNTSKLNITSDTVEKRNTESQDHKKTSLSILPKNSGNWFEHSQKDLNKNVETETVDVDKAREGIVSEDVDKAKRAGTFSEATGQPGQIVVHCRGMELAVERKETVHNERFYELKRDYLNKSRARENEYKREGELEKRRDIKSIEKNEWKHITYEVPREIQKGIKKENTYIVNREANSCKTNKINNMPHFEMMEQQESERKIIQTTGSFESSTKNNEHDLDKQESEMNRNQTRDNLESITKENQKEHIKQDDSNTPDIPKSPTLFDAKPPLSRKSTRFGSHEKIIAYRPSTSLDQFRKERREKLKQDESSNEIDFKESKQIWEEVNTLINNSPRRVKEFKENDINLYPEPKPILVPSPRDRPVNAIEFHRILKRNELDKGPDYTRDRLWKEGDSGDDRSLLSQKGDSHIYANISTNKHFGRGLMDEVFCETRKNKHVTNSFNKENTVICLCKLDNEMNDELDVGTSDKGQISYTDSNGERVGRGNTISTDKLWGCHQDMKDMRHMQLVNPGYGYIRQFVIDPTTGACKGKPMAMTTTLPRLTPSATPLPTGITQPPPRSHTSASMYSAYPPKDLSSSMDYLRIPGRINPLAPPPPRKRINWSWETTDQHYENEKRRLLMQKREHTRYHSAWGKAFYGAPAEKEAYRRHTREVLKQQMTDSDAMKRQESIAKVTESTRAISYDRECRVNDANEYHRKHSYLMKYRDDNKSGMEQAWASQKYNRNVEDRVDRERLRYNPINWSCSLK